MKSEGQRISAYTTPNFHETLGVNDRVALAQAEKEMRRLIAEKHMRNGVTIINPEQTVISADAEIGRDTVIQPGVVIEGSTKIGSNCVIGPNSHLQNSTVGDQTTIHSSVVRDSQVGSQTAVGPFAHLRPETQLGNHVKIGNFVEVKKSQLGDDSKVSHLSYIGDAEIGKNVNVGCGTITVNYDGKNKHKTEIQDDAFIGCNANLVAPVTVGKNAIVAAGSTITKSVPENSLAIARVRQENKEGYVKN